MNTRPHDQATSSCSAPLPQQPADATDADVVPGGYVPPKLASFVAYGDLVHVVLAQPFRQAPNPALAVR
jgi:hypothetical protein